MQTFSQPSPPSQLLRFLILLNLVWGMIALFYDLPAIAKIPPYAWPFVVICPIYPFLLSIIWSKHLSRRPIPDTLLAFAALPSALYGLLALSFYPLLAYRTGPQWQDFAQILWVVVYALQGWYLLRTHPIQKQGRLLASLFLIFSFTLQYQTLAYDYLAYDELPASDRTVLLLLALALLGFLNYLLGKQVIQQHALLDRSH